MTEREWHKGSKIEAMVEYVQQQSQARKLRLFSCGCCRQLTPWIKNERLLQAIDRAEKFADGELRKSTLDKWRQEVNRLNCRIPQQPYTAKKAVHYPISSACITHDDATCTVVWRTLADGPTVFGHEFNSTGPKLVLALVRDIFGNPFRSVAFDPAWRTDTAVSLARHMYEGRDFSAMPILADALQDAGCECADILNHCRDEKQLHVRGCWVVDLVLGKT